MGSLASELRPIAAQLTDAPRVYVDANVPWGVVTFMRRELHWDVFFVLEDPALRRARDREHFDRARELGRTLVTLDGDFLDDRHFPLDVSPGVIVIAASDERIIVRLLRSVDRELRATPSLPFRGRKLTLTSDLVAGRAR